MSESKKYLQEVIGDLEEVAEKQTKALEEAGKLIADACEAGGRFYTFGTGHSHLIAEEIYARAGGLAWVKAILPTELMVLDMVKKSTALERLEGYAEKILELYRVEGKDVMLIISNSGRNAVPVEMALAAKEKGCKVIAITSLKHTKAVASRHSSGKKLYQIADVVLDNLAVPGDARHHIEGFENPVGATSDVVGIALAQAMVVEAVDEMVRRGMNPPVFKSSNMDGADEYNNKLFDKYFGYIK